MALVVLAAELSRFVARPDASAQQSVQRSGTVAVVDNARTPAMASVAGPRPACGVHLSGPSGVRPVRCPAVGVRPSVGRVRLVPIRRQRLGTGRCGKATPTTGTGRDPDGLPRRRAARVDGRAGPDAGDAAGVAHGRRAVGGGPGGRVGCGRRPRLTAERPAARPACGAPSAAAALWHGSRPQRGCHTGRVAAVLVMGGRPRWVVVVEAAARVDGPGGADGHAGGDGRAAPARPRPPASDPGSLPTALSPAGLGGGPART